MGGRKGRPAPARACPRAAASLPHMHRPLSCRPLPLLRPLPPLPGQVSVVMETAVNKKSTAKAQAPLAIGFSVFCAHAVLLPIDGERAMAALLCSWAVHRGGGDTAPPAPSGRSLTAPPSQPPAICTSCFSTAGCSINPARSLGPAIISDTWPGHFWRVVAAQRSAERPAGTPARPLRWRRQPSTAGRACRLPAWLQGVHCGALCGRPLRRALPPLLPLRLGELGGEEGGGSRRACWPPACLRACMHVAMLPWPCSPATRACCPPSLPAPPLSLRRTRCTRRPSSRRSASAPSRRWRSPSTCAAPVAGPGCAVLCCAVHAMIGAAGPAGGCPRWAADAHSCPSALSPTPPPRAGHGQRQRAAGPEGAQGHRQRGRVRPPLKARQQHALRPAGLFLPGSSSVELPSPFR